MKELINSQIMLYRQVNDRIRYYCLKIHPTLFAGYILIREYGSEGNRKPTRVVEEHFNHFEEAFSRLKLIVARKTKKGYL
jgi:predicted DNA-binding WGR domain protein